MTHTATDERIHIQELECRFIDACLKNDTLVLDSILADDFVFTDPSGVTLTKQEWLTDLASGDFRFEEIQIQGLKVSLREETVTVEVGLKLKAQAKKSGYDGTYSAMDVYEKRRGQWKLILSTANRVKA